MRLIVCFFFFWMDFFNDSFIRSLVIFKGWIIKWNINQTKPGRKKRERKIYILLSKKRKKETSSSIHNSSLQHTLEMALHAIGNSISRYTVAYESSANVTAVSRASNRDCKTKKKKKKKMKGKIERSATNDSHEPPLFFVATLFQCRPSEMIGVKV